MGKIVGGVVLGYITMFVAVFLLFSAGYLLLGADGSYEAGSWDVSFAWVILSIVIGLAAAVAGGFVCASISDNPKATQGLVGLVVVLGLLMALPAVMGGSSEVATTIRPDTAGLFDAMMNARQPSWLALLNPLLGAVGIIVGARLKRT